jgi:hypothetical protein
MNMNIYIFKKGHVIYFIANIFTFKKFSHDFIPSVYRENKKILPVELEGLVVSYHNQIKLFRKKLRTV